jgi:cyclopropane fatty-acyl-phospholipid synthase-like methyltransferase
VSSEMSPEPHRIGKEHYDSSDYFEGEAARHLADADSAFQRYRIEKVMELAQPRAVDRVVDLGCGWGTFEFALAGRVAHVVGVDFSERSIELCRRRLAADPRPHVSFVCADAGATGLDAGAYDLVIAADLFEHLYPVDSARVSAEAWRLLAPGGRFAVWTPHRGHVLEILKNRNIVLRRDVTHVDYKSIESMKRLLSDAGFTIERAYYAESHVPGLRAIERRLQSFVPPLRRRIAVLGRKRDRTARAETDS